MLRAGVNPRSEYVAAFGEALPFRDGQFDGLFLIKVLKHVANVAPVLGERPSLTERRYMRSSHA